MAPIKVVRMISRLNTGGPAIHTVLLTRGLDAQRFTSRLVTGVVGPTEGDMSYYADRMGVTPVVVPELGRTVAWRSDLVALVRLFRLLRREQPDIVHTHTAKAGGLGRIAAVAHNVVARLTGRRPAILVHTFHGHIFHGYFGRLVSRALVVAERLAALATARVVTVSESVKRDLVERYRICPEPKVTVVPLGIDFEWTAALEDRAGRLRETYGIPRDAVVLALVGRITAIKNHSLLVSSLSLVRRANIATLILGDGELRSELERVVQQHGLRGSVFFTKWMQDPATMYADVDIVCLTSNNEGTPVALIEAMAAGRPFVATRVGGVPDLALGEAVVAERGVEVYANGIHVPPNDPEALAAGIRYLVDRPAMRQAMGAVGQAAALKTFSKERLDTDMEAIYLALLHERRRR